MPSDPTRFIADAMLGSLARKLRIFGFDTLYFRDGPDAELERIARAETRIVLTSDRALLEHTVRTGLPTFMISGRGDGARLGSLVAQADASSITIARGPPRCALCNGALERVGRPQVEGYLPAAVTSRHRLYYRCVPCKKFYWRGGHWSRMRRLSSLMNRRAHSDDGLTA